MGIDPDAYMAGAIPSLNRGGSWRMDDGHGSQFQSFQGPGSGSGTRTGAGNGNGNGGSIFPRPSIIVPPAASHTHMSPQVGNANLNLNLDLNRNTGNRGNFLPFQSQAMSVTGYPGFMTPSMGSPSVRPDGTGSQYQSQSHPSQRSGSGMVGSVQPVLVLGAARGSQGGGSAGSHRVQSVRSANHPGWASLSAGGGGVGVKGHKSSPNSPTTPSSGNLIAGQATAQYGLNPSTKSQIKRPLVSPRVVEPGWDWDTASHKRTPTLRRSMTAGSDYFSLAHSHEQSPTTTMTAPNTPLGGGGHHLDSLPPPPRPAPQSPRPRAESQSQLQAQPQTQSQSPSPYRPSGPTRRHTHDRFSPDPEPALERSGKVTKFESKSLGRARVKSGLRKAIFEVNGDEGVGSEAGESYYAPSTKTYAHTLDDRPSARRTPPISGSTNTTTVGPRSERAVRPVNTRRSSSSVLPSSPLASGVTHSSFGEKRFKNRPHLGSLSTITSTVDFTQTAPSSATGTKHHRQPPPPSMDMRSLQDALTVAETPIMPQTAPVYG